MIITCTIIIITTTTTNNKKKIRRIKIRINYYKNHIKIKCSNTACLSSIDVITSLADPRNFATLIFLATLSALVYYSVIFRNISAQLRAELTMALAWLIFPFLPCTCGLFVVVSGSRNSK